ncbi:MAG TPA: metal-binding protein, partial [Bacillota bacterium]|nr:metal-binding protein [Bacillota bacterium]
MNLQFAYLGRSTLRPLAGGHLLSLAPNLSREPVSFDAPLRQPLRFREAISALHDMVISDLRFKPRDKSAYEEWKKSERSRVTSLRQQAYQQARQEILARRGEAVPPDLEKQFGHYRSVYWNARQQYASYLLKNDPQLWRLLMPCDPVITVAEDVVFFECFSADESSYGCLSVNREAAFGKAAETRLGTTNVDYSWDLYDHFQSLRSYRETRFRVDPAGFTVATEGQADYREEKIDLPEGWLRGFMQTQAAMTLPARRVTLTQEAIYSILAFLKRHKARKSPRALRFELVAGRPPMLVLEPWEQRVPVYGEAVGTSCEPIR